MTSLSKDPLRDMQAREAIRAREAAENSAAHEIAKRNGTAHTFIAADGCEVTVTPDGHVFHNAAANEPSEVTVRRMRTEDWPER